MDCALALLAAAALGVTFGWEPAGDGSDGVEYVVQLEPELVDVLQSGQSVPIESYVPNDVGPVRKVRIVVGRDALVQSAGSEAAAEEPIVRGQSADEPLNYSAQFANDGWSDDRYRYDTPPAWPTNNSAAPATAAPAWPASNSTAPSTSSTASPLWPQTPLDSSRVAPASSRQTTPAWTSVGITASPPPAFTPSMSAAPTAPASSSHFDPATKNNRYLATPFDDHNQTSPPAVSWERTAMATSVATSNSDGEHSVLALPDPPPTGRLQLPSPPPLSAPTNSRATTGNSGWDTGWGTTAGNTSTAADPDLVPVVPLSSRRQDQSPASAAQTARPSSPQASPWPDDDKWSWPTDRQPAAASQTVASPPTTDWPAQPANGSPTVPLRSDWPATSTPAATANNGWGDAPERYNQPAATNSAPAGWPAEASTGPPVQTPAGQTATLSPQSPAANLQSPVPSPQPQPPSGGEQQPWMPLLLVSLVLAGSIGANLFLSWSYMDARQRYRTLVRKTTDAFHRATGAAA